MARDTSKLVAIPGELHSVATDGIVNTITSSNVINASLFAKGVNHNNPYGSYIAGVTKINNVKIYNDLELIADIYPTINNNIPCLYDIVGEIFFHELNNGVLAVE